VIASLNRLVDLVEQDLAEDLDVVRLAAALGTTEHHLRRMFSSLAGMPLSEYVRRRRMTVAAAEVVSGSQDLLGIAVRHGYGSAEASAGRSGPCTASARARPGGTAAPSAASLA
jgi:AraC family transcriptional regulator